MLLAVIKLAGLLCFTFNPDDELAGGSVPGLIVHFVSDDVCSLFKVGVWGLAD